MEPARFRLPRRTLALVRRAGRLAEGELYDFIEARINYRQPRFKDKECGYSNNGNVECQLHVDLRLWHYRLTAHPDPLLIYQELDGFLNFVGVATHEDIFFGSGERWCHEFQETIIWDGHEDKLDTLNELFGPLSQ